MSDQTKIIRRAGKGDAHALFGLAVRTFVDTWGASYRPDDFGEFLAEKMTFERHRRLLEDERYAVWFAEHGGVPVGYSAAGPCGLPVPDLAPGCGEIMHVYVTREAQGDGYGRRLTQAALAWLNERHRTIYLGVWSENYRAQALYASLGFRKAHEYAFIVGKQADDEWIMERCRVSPD